jgi:hypothetical protein
MIAVHLIPACASIDYQPRSATPPHYVTSFRRSVILLVRGVATQFATLAKWEYGLIKVVGEGVLACSALYDVHPFRMKGDEESRAKETRGLPSGLSLFCKHVIINE